MKLNIKKVILLFLTIFCLSFSELIAQVAVPASYGGPWNALSTPGAWTGWHESGTAVDNATNMGDALGGASVFGALNTWVGVYFSNQAGPVTYYARYVTTSTNRILVEESPDGISWTTLHTPGLLANNNTTQYTTPCPLAATRYIRWRSSTWTAGSMRVDAITVSQGVLPVANFSGTPTSVTAGGSVTYTDLSSPAATSWSWSFPGGTPATSTAQNPTIVYNTVGTYNVTLIATNCIGAGAPVTKSNYITVTAAPASGCNAVGNVVIFSNYDGSKETVAGRLNIDVDVNIPNLKIGICSYERVTVNIGGAFAGNVTKVIYAGYNGSTNCNCYWPSTPAGCNVTSVITGVPAGIISYVTMPPSTYIDPDGYGNIICAYQCTSGNQGGCNTAGQVVGYFLSAFGAGSTFNSHETQYGCWAGAIKKLSTSGNCCLTPLPIELISFNTSSIDNKTVTAKWSTASETNNDFFTIERSKDAFNYEEIGQVKGAGNSNIKLDYSFLDNYPLKGINYYRLKQTDFDGKFAYSEISTANMSDALNSGFTLYPNPSSTTLNCLLTSEEETTVSYNIKDVAGKILIHDEFESLKQSIDISVLAAGIYIIEFASDTKLMQGKFIKE